MAQLEKPGFMVDWDRGMLSDGSGKSTVLRAQSLAVLRLLHARVGHLVSKSELLDRVWPGLAVTDDSLVQCVTDLRRALGDADHTLIKTVPKRGYILEAPVSGISLAGTGASPALSALGILGQEKRSSADNILEQSIAVLPFANLNGDAEHDYFTDGLSEDIIAELSKEPGLFVIARSTSLSYKGKAVEVGTIAMELGVKYILEGSVRRAGNRVRVVATLNDAFQGRQLWAQRYDRDMVDIFAVQDEVTQKIVSSISGNLADRAVDQNRPKNLIAYDLLLRGRHLWGFSSEACLRGLQYLQEAVSLEPDYAVAHSALAVTHVCGWLVWSGPEEPARRLGDYHSKLAVSLAPMNSEVLFRRGWVCLSRGKYDEAEAFFREAKSVNLNDANSWMGSADLYFLTGKPDAAVDACAHALRFNPRPPPWYFLTIGSALIAAGKYQQAVGVLAPAVDGNGSARRFLAVALAKLGRNDEAAKHANLFIQTSPLWKASEHIKRRAFKFEKDRLWWQAAYSEAGLPL